MDVRRVTVTTDSPVTTLAETKRAAAARTRAALVFMVDGCVFCEYYIGNFPGSENECFEENDSGKVRDNEKEERQL